MKVVVDITFENIEDSEFCEKSSRVLFITFSCSIFSFLSSSSMPEARVFELFTNILEKHSSNALVCFSILMSLRIFISVLSGTDILDRYINPLFKSGIFRTLVSIMENTKNDFVASECRDLFIIFSKRGKSIIIFSPFHFSHFF